MNDGPYCAHLRVNWTTRQLGDGMTEGWWECQDCKSKFCPVAAAEYRIAALLDDKARDQEVLRKMTADAAELAAELRQFRICYNGDENKPFAVGRTALETKGDANGDL